jgi:hypothetical protein
MELRDSMRAAERILSEVLKAQSRLGGRLVRLEEQVVQLKSLEEDRFSRRLIRSLRRRLRRG